MTYEECSSQANIDNSKPLNEMMVENFTRSYAELYNHIKEKYGQTPKSSPPIKPSMEFSQNYCATYSGEYNSLQRELSELIKNKCIEIGEECAFRPYVQNITNNHYISVLLTSRGNSYYILKTDDSGDEHIILNDDLMILLKSGLMPNSIDKELGILRLYGCSHKNEKRECTITYMQLNKDSADVIKLINNNDIPNTNTPQLDYEFGIKFHEQNLDNRGCPYIVY